MMCVSTVPLAFYMVFATIVCHCIGTSSAQYGGNDFDFGGGAGATCPMFQCGNDKEAVPKKLLSFKSEGCNSMGGISMMMPGSGKVGLTDFNTMTL